tara:strand:- start:110 stop:331 length:222 start_codon:yes stop_codon:yes gene_type:complete
MKRADKREINLKLSSLKEYDLNKSSVGCAPCLKEALKIERQVGKKTLTEIKIEEIKNIVNSIFMGLNNGNKEN